MKIKKYSALILAGVLTCTAPASVFAQDVTEVAESIIEENQLDSLMEDPDKVTDLILYVKEQIGQADVSDEEIMSVIQMAEENLQIDLTEEDENSLLEIVKKVKDMNLDEEKLRSQISSVYEKLEKLGIEKEDVKSFIEKMIDFVKGFIE